MHAQFPSALKASEHGGTVSNVIDPLAQRLPQGYCKTLDYVCLFGSGVESGRIASSRVSCACPTGHDALPGSCAYGAVQPACRGRGGWACTAVLGLFCCKVWLLPGIRRCF